MNTKQMAFPLQVKALDEKTGEFTGYGAVFGNKDSYGDVIVRGAFNSFLATNPPQNVKLLWQHRSDHPIGIYKEIYEDENGLVVKGQLLVDDVAQAREAYALLKAGAISGLSIGYSIKKDGSHIGQDGLHYLNDIELWEISIVTFPANPLANVNGVKAADNIQNIRDFEKFLRDVGFSKKDATAIASHGYKAIGSRCDTDSDAELLSAIKKLNQLITE